MRLFGYKDVRMLCRRLRLIKYRAYGAHGVQEAAKASEAQQSMLHIYQLRLRHMSLYVCVYLV